MSALLATEETLMKIHVSQIPPEGLQTHATYHPASLDMERDDVHLIEPFEMDAFITKVDGELVVKADIRCPLRCACARCLEEFDSTVRANALLSYSVQPTDVVDITNDIRQEIILAYPMFPACQPGCKGLCSQCGQNLNQGTCSH